MDLILYARKSSESEDRQVQSIPDQVKILRDLAEKNRWNIVSELTESKSAKAPYVRDEFTKMVEMIQNGAADGILCWSLNRISRNPIDSGQIQWLLQEGVIKAIHTCQRSYFSDENIMIFKVESGMAEQYPRDLSRDVKRGLTTKLENGIYPSLAPEGYLNNLYTKQIEIDPERYPLLERMWKIMAEGETSLNQMAILLKQWGYRTRPNRKVGNLPLTKSNVHALLYNPFYVGYFRWRGELHKGNHQAMIDWNTFHKVHEHLGRRGKTRPRRYEFNYTNVLTCGRCGHAFTAEKKTKKHHVYYYYHCSRMGECGERSLREENIEEFIVDKLLHLKNMEPESMQILRLELPRWYEAEAGAGIGALEATQRRLTDIQRELSGLISMRSRGELDEQEFLPRKAELKSQALAVERTIDESKTRIEEANKTMLELIDFIENFSVESYRAEGPVGKKKIAKKLGINYTVLNGKINITYHPLLEPLIIASKSMKKGHPEDDRPSWLALSDVIRTFQQIWNLSLAGQRF